MLASIRDKSDGSLIVGRCWSCLLIEQTNLAASRCTALLCSHKRAHIHSHTCLHIKPTTHPLDLPSLIHTHNHPLAQTKRPYIVRNSCIPTHISNRRSKELTPPCLKTSLGSATAVAPGHTGEAAALFSDELVTTYSDNAERDSPPTRQSHFPRTVHAIEAPSAPRHSTMSPHPHTFRPLGEATHSFIPPLRYPTTPRPTYPH